MVLHQDPLQGMQMASETPQKMQKHIFNSRQRHMSNDGQCSVDLPMQTCCASSKENCCNDSAANAPALGLPA